MHSFSILIIALCVSSLWLVPVFAVDRCIVGDADAVNDNTVTIANHAGAVTMRNDMISHIFGSDGWPRLRQPDALNLSAVDTVGVTGWGALTQITVDPRTGSGFGHDTDPTLRTNAYLYINNTAARNNRAVILHHGHACTFDDGGGTPAYRMEATLQALLNAGYDVAIQYMIQSLPGDCSNEHDNLWSSNVANPSTGSKMRWFVLSPIVLLNYLDTLTPRYQDYSMVGLSGGGWMTHLVAALDPRIKRSVPTAGSLPCYLRNHVGSYGDAEQNWSDFYSLFGYLDIYTLSGYGKYNYWQATRYTVHALNVEDDCCFGNNDYTPTEGWDGAVNTMQTTVQTAFTNVLNNRGGYELYKDTGATTHQIGVNTHNDIIIPLLAGTYP